MWVVFIMNSKYIPYTGVGSRSITKEERSLIIRISKYFAFHSFILRSGKALGADKACLLYTSDAADE